MDHKSRTPINKGNYSMDTKERELAFHSKLGSDWPKEYNEYRENWSYLAKNHIVSDYPLLVDIELSSISTKIHKMYISKKIFDIKQKKEPTHRQNSFSFKDLQDLSSLTIIRSINSIQKISLKRKLFFIVSIH